MNNTTRPLRCIEVRDAQGNPRSKDKTACWEAVDPALYLPPPRRGIRSRFYQDDAELIRSLWDTFNGPLPPNTTVLRGCGVTTCCNPWHLVTEPVVG